MNNDLAHLPPLTELIPKIDFEVFGLGSPMLGLQLGGLHYGVDEGEGKIIGLTLCYAQKFRGSPRVLIVESSLIPDSVDIDNRVSLEKWSLPSLQHLRECIAQLHNQEPRGWVDEETLERKFLEELEAIRKLQWSPLQLSGVPHSLESLEVARSEDELILARTFAGRKMLLVGSFGLQPTQFVEAVKSLLPLQKVRPVVERHQSEFELLTQEG